MDEKTMNDENKDTAETPVEEKPTKAEKKKSQS